MLEKFKLNISKNFSNSPKAKILFSLIIVGILFVTIYSMKKTIVVRVDGEDKTITTFKGTVEGAINDSKLELAPEDKVQPSLKEKISKSTVIEVKRAISVNVTVDGNLTEYKSAEHTVSDLLASKNITVGEMDKVSPSMDTKISKGMDIELIKVKKEVVKDTEIIDFSTIVKEDDTIEEGVTKTTVDGTNGEKEVTYEVIYENGKQVSKLVVAENITKQPVDKLVSKGSLKTVAVSRGSSGSERAIYKKKISVVATAYTHSGSRTATGSMPVRNSGGLSTIAVDPKVIPLGTKVYIEGYGYAIAQDTGGAIKNNKIDLFMNSESECNTWGRRDVNLYIVAYPGQW